LPSSQVSPASGRPLPHGAPGSVEVVVVVPPGSDDEVVVVAPGSVEEVVPPGREDEVVEDEVVEDEVVVVAPGIEVVEGTEVVVTVVLDVVVVGAGHWQPASQVVPPGQLLRPGGSHCSPLDSTPSPHRTSHVVPPALQHILQLVEKPRHALTAALKVVFAVFTHWRFGFPVPVHSALLAWNAAL
jgi:hypothetical protein